MNKLTLCLMLFALSFLGWSGSVFAVKTICPKIIKSYCKKLQIFDASIKKKRSLYLQMQKMEKKFDNCFLFVKGQWLIRARRDLRRPVSTRYRRLLSEELRKHANCSIPSVSKAKLDFSELKKSNSELSPNNKTSKSEEEDPLQADKKSEQSFDEKYAKFTIDDPERFVRELQLPLKPNSAFDGRTFGNSLIGSLIGTAIGGLLAGFARGDALPTFFLISVPAVLGSSLGAFASRNSFYEGSFGWALGGGLLGSAGSGLLVGVTFLAMGNSRFRRDPTPYIALVLLGMLGPALGSSIVYHRKRMLKKEYRSASSVAGIQDLRVLPWVAGDGGGLSACGSF